MPAYVVSRLQLELARRFGRSLCSAKILVLGLAYKRNIADVRESPTFAIMDILTSRGARFDYHDALVSMVPPTREHGRYTGLQSVDLTAEALAAYDAVVLSTDHDSIDYALVAKGAKLVIDTRNDFARRGLAGANVARA